MKKSIVIAAAVGFLTFITMAGRAHAQAPNQSAENQAALLQQTSAELRRLRLEVIEQAIEFQNWKIMRLERELQPIQDELRRLSEREQAITQLVADLNNHRTNTSPAQEALEEIEAAKAAFTEKGLKKLSIKRQLAAQRETELTEQLEQERRRLQEFISLIVITRRTGPNAP
jgi:hypothetical protein